MLTITHEMLMANNDDLLKREDVIHALLSAFTTWPQEKDLHRLNAHEVKALLNIINLKPSNK